MSHGVVYTILSIALLLPAIVVHGRTVQDDQNHSTRSQSIPTNRTLLLSSIAFPPLNASYNTWRIVVNGWHYQDNDKTWLELAGLQSIQLLANSESILTGLGLPNPLRYQDRLRLFFVTDKSYELLTIKLADKLHPVRTDERGHFTKEIVLTEDAMRQLKQQQHNQITLEVIDDQGEKTIGSIELIEPGQGISVISDIDDTIKISHMSDQVRLLVNTFTSPYESVAGMSKLYRQWSTNSNCTFHYLSGMPDQLYLAISAFMRDNEFPTGSIHMRHTDMTFTSLVKFIEERSTYFYKMNHIESFLGLTERLYVLVGDTAEQDPEIYGNIARRYPERIRGIFIRAANNELSSDQRFVNAFNGVPEEKWLIFNDVQQLPSDLLRMPRSATSHLSTSS